jgi:hypothetical protein
VSGVETEGGTAGGKYGDERERKDIGWIIAGFAVVLVVACAGLFGSFGLLASTH